jgi:hypothetical protein
MVTPKEVLALARESGTEIVDLRFSDLPGLMQHFSIPMHELSEESFEEGLGFDGSSIRGFQEIQESDMLLVPDPDTAYLDPFTRHTTLNLHCFVKDPVTGEMYTRDPRYVARSASSTYSTRSASIRTSTRATTTSTRSRASGTRDVSGRSPVSRTWATSLGTRRGTSPCPRWTTTRICARRWS